MLKFMWNADVVQAFLSLPLGDQDIRLWQSEPAGTCSFKALYKHLLPRHKGPSLRWCLSCKCSVTACFLTNCLPDLHLQDGHSPLTLSVQSVVRMKKLLTTSLLSVPLPKQFGILSLGQSKNHTTTPRFLTGSGTLLPLPIEDWE